ncbi:hypothetical protein B0H13DRAFT_1880665 [Mycena leptocephala]|nr:hypothetical protein B0H13DRAFT_1880665 [Mycena leptocephala]
MTNAGSHRPCFVAYHIFSGARTPDRVHPSKQDPDKPQVGNTIRERKKSLYIPAHPSLQLNILGPSGRRKRGNKDVLPLMEKDGGEMVSRTLSHISEFGKRPQAVCVSRLADWTSRLLAFEHLVYTERQGPGEVGRLKGLLREMIKFAEVVPQKWVLEKVRTRAANGVEERRLRAGLVEVVFNGYKAYETEGQLADFSAALLGMWMERLLNVQSYQ